MHRQINLILCFLAVVLLPCCSNKSHEFNTDGVGFTVPGDWTIRQETLPDSLKVLTCEKTGNDESAVAVITIYNSVFDPSDVLENTRDAMLQNSFYNEPGITFSEMTGGRFLKGRSLCMNFIFKDVESGHEGSISVFELCNKTVTVMMQQHMADRDRNAEDFNKFTASFRCSL